MGDILDEDAVPSLLYIGAISIATGCSLASGWATALMNPLVCYESEPGCPVGGLEFDVREAKEVELKQGLTSVLVAGAALGSFLQAIPDRVGYKATLMWVVAPLFALGTILCAGANSQAIIGMFYAGRFISGIGCGVGGLVAPVLLAEMAPSEIRGFLTGLHQQFITIGIFFAGLSGYLLVTFVPGGWRYTFALGMFSPIMLWLTTWAFIPESPRWLLRQRGGRRKVQTLLLNVRPLSYEISEEIQSMQKEVDEERRERRMRGTSRDQQSTLASWMELFEPHHAGAVALGCGLMIVQTLSGINTVIFYSSSILELASESNTRAKTTGFFAANVIATVLGLWLLDRMGRRPLLIIGYSVMTVALLGLSATLYFMDSQDTKAAWGAVAGVSIYLCGFAIGPGVTTFTLLSEMIPTKIRGKAFGLFMAVNWICVLLLSQTTLSLIRALGHVTSLDTSASTDNAYRSGVAKLYFICTFFSLSGLLLVLFFVKETMGTSLEDSARIMEGHDDAPQAPVIGSLGDPYAAQALLAGSEDASFPGGRMGDGRAERGVSIPMRGDGGRGYDDRGLAGAESGGIQSAQSAGQASLGVLPGSFAPGGGTWGQQQPGGGSDGGAVAPSGGGGAGRGEAPLGRQATSESIGSDRKTGAGRGSSWRPTEGVLSRDGSSRSGPGIEGTADDGRSGSGLHSINEGAALDG